LVPAIKGRLNPGGGYFIFERFLRHRTWSEIGFKTKTFFKDLLANWWLVVLVGFITQIIPILIAKTILPEYLAHIQERLPLDISGGIGTLAILLRLPPWPRNWFTGPYSRNAWRGIGHTPRPGIGCPGIFCNALAPGQPVVVFTDLAFVAIDAVIYGAIFARCENISSPGWRTSWQMWSGLRL